MESKLDIRIANIIETDKIVINKGDKDGIDEHMRFLVYEEGEEIFDPISKKSLGILENPKGIFKVLHIQDLMTVLISELKRPSKLALTITQFADVNAERDLLRTIKIGDKIKIIN